MAKDEEKSGKAHHGNDVLQMVTSLVIGLFFILGGLPLWWKTTTTYRATLPFSEIHALAHRELVCTIPVILVSCQKLSPEQLRITGKVFEEILNKNSSSMPGLLLRYSVTSRGCSDAETELLKSKQNFDERDVHLEDVARSADAQVFLLPELLWGSKEDIYVGRHNTIYALTEKADRTFHNLLNDIAAMFQDFVVNERSLTSVYITSKGVRLDKVDPDTVRAVQSTPEYELSFTLMNSDPSQVIARWNIEQSVKGYLQPFLDKLNTFAEFSISSQVLYYSELPVTPKKAKNSSYFYLSSTSLPLLINPLETKLGSDVSMYPTLNFVVFVPSMKHSPLYIHNKKGDVVSNNAFFSPRWGVIQVQNPPPLEDNTTMPAEYHVDTRSAMEVFLSELRVLLGIPNQKYSKGLAMAGPGQAAVTEWELQGLLRKRTIENMVTASNTLYSLSRLLEKIHNMIINDDVAQEVYGAVDYLGQAHSYLEKGNLVKAFHASKRAIASSEKAFFDPSLLELLYFPEDQKFAIYIPLFLPVGIPVLAALFKALKWIKAKRKEKQS